VHLALFRQHDLVLRRSRHFRPGLLGRRRADDRPVQLWAQERQAGLLRVRVFVRTLVLRVRLHLPADQP
jgi:hypothetical protein